MVEKIVEYSSLQQDLVQTRNPAYQLPEEYCWIHSNPIYSLSSFVLYRIFQVFAFFYLHMRHHLRIENRQVLNMAKEQGFFLYINHTQAIADPFLASQILKKRRGYIICRKDNLAIPVLGKLLPSLGALPIPDNRKQMSAFRKAIAARIKQKQAVVIFPEGHVWNYANFLRPFSLSSFGFPVENNAPSFCASVTYDAPKQKGARPDMHIYIDGPFYPDGSLSRPAARKKLQEQIENAMQSRIEGRSYEYIHYVYKE
jgi:1-acyl-sn-glycerol-3-phosphate acyltransferase